jgi:tRNA (guanine37-N1)-methyltransferase
LTSPRGAAFDQRLARQWIEQNRDTIIVCGRYEGVDERVGAFVDGEISIGDLILTGGELAALAIIDATARLYPGVLGNEASAVGESFEDELLEYGQFTRPPVFRGLSVPEVLQSGDHARIARWRRWHSLRLTRECRPDLFGRRPLTPEEQELLKMAEDDL